MTRPPKSLFRYGSESNVTEGLGLTALGSPGEEMIGSGKRGGSDREADGFAVRERLRNRKTEDRFVRFFRKETSGSILIRLPASN